MGARLLRVVGYYVVLFGGLALLGPTLRPALPARLAAAIERLTDGRGLATPAFGGSVEAVDPQGLALAAALAMIAAMLLSLPIAWVYTVTRARRGYRQSVVQSLVLLPVVVAGVVVLVKHSLALAFSLAGIVAAVRFRNTLEDSKDAVHIFLATAIGLAAGVDLAVAAAVSVIFNIVIVAIWYGDLGRGARLEGRAAELRLQRVLNAANRTGTFVAKLDREVLSDMSAEQLEALADRAWRRRRSYAPERTGERPTYNAVVRVRTGDADAIRADLERALELHAKRWRYGSTVQDGDGVLTMEYAVQLRKGRTRDVVREAIYARCGERAVGVEVL